MKVALAIFAFTLLCVVTASTSTNQRFPVYWNVKSGVCYEEGRITDVAKHGIIVNTNHSLVGDKIVILYEGWFKYLPIYKDSDPNQPVYGGLPQKINWPLYLNATAELFKTSIPDKDFSGPVIVDIEKWRPLWSYNYKNSSFEVYRKKSLEYVRERFPNLTDKEVYFAATKEFERAAMDIFVETMRLGRKLRPRAKWGFYGFPPCGTNTDITICPPGYRGFNNAIYNEVTVLFPSIYLYPLKYENQTTSQDDELINRAMTFIRAVLGESRRISKQYKPNLPIYPFTLFEMNPDNPHKGDFLIKEYLCAQIKQSADIGTEGLILWSHGIKMNERCENISRNLNKVLGPAVQEYRSTANRCSLEHCSGHGKCVLGDFNNECRRAESVDFREYHCECDPGFEGLDCQKKPKKETKGTNWLLIGVIGALGALLLLQLLFRRRSRC